MNNARHQESNPHPSSTLDLKRTAPLSVNSMTLLRCLHETLRYLPLDIMLALIPHHPHLCILCHLQMLPLLGNQRGIGQCFWKLRQRIGGVAHAGWVGAKDAAARFGEEHVVLNAGGVSKAFGDLSHIGDNAHAKLGGRKSKVVKEFGFGGRWVLGRGAGGDGGAERVTEGIGAGGEGTCVRNVLEELLTATGIDRIAVCLLKIGSG